MSTRDELHRLVDSLPDDSLPRAHASLERLKSGPPALLNRERALERSQEMFLKMNERMQLRVQEAAARNPAQRFVSVGAGGGRWSNGQRSSRHSFGYFDGDWTIHETTLVQENVELVLVDRRRVDHATHKLLFNLEVRGPDGTSTRHEHAFDVADKNRH